MIWLLVVVLIIGVVLWLGSGVLSAYVEVKRRPREAMMWCNKHGFIRHKHVLPIPGITDVCPICFKGAWDKAGKV